MFVCVLFGHKGGMLKVEESMIFFINLIVLICIDLIDYHDKL